MGKTSSAITAAISGLNQGNTDLTSGVNGLQKALMTTSNVISSAVSGMNSANSSLTSAVNALKASLSGLSPYTVKSSHPRLLDFSTLPAKVATTAGATLWKAIITAAQGTTFTEDRMICAAAIYVAGLIQGFTYKFTTPSQYGNQALSDYLVYLTQSPKNELQTTGYRALMYDWLWPLITGTSNQPTILTALQKIMDTRDTSAAGMWNWSGYNNKAGDGMSIALATYGDITNKDYVADYWTNNWNSTTLPVDEWNWHWIIQQEADCGNNEGFGYYGASCEVNWLTRACWKSATTGSANSFLDIGWFDNFPLWMLFIHEPGFPKYAGISNNIWPWIISCKNYESAYWSSQRGYWDMLAAATSGPNGPLARWVFEQAIGYPGGFSSPSTQLIYGLLMGDPRVTSVSPTNLKTPMTFTKMIGDVFMRNAWDKTSTSLYFGNNRWGMRSVATNGLCVYKNVPLLGYRGGIWDHTYEPGDFACSVVFYSGTQLAIIPHSASTDNSTNKASGTLIQNSDGSWTGNSIGNYITKSGFSLSQINTCSRTVKPSSDLSTTVVTDVVSCSSTLTPHVVWNCMTGTQPVVNGNTITITGSDGITTCVLTMNQSLQAVVIGGYPTHFADAFDGTTPSSGLSNFTAMTAGDQIHSGGYWRVHVLMPAGGCTLITTIAVH